MKFKIAYEMNDKLKEDENIQNAKNSFAIAFFEQIKDKIDFSYEVGTTTAVIDSKEVKKSTITIIADMIEFKDVVKPIKEVRPNKVKTIVPYSKPKEKSEGDV